MASYGAMLGRSPTCLACMRKLANPLARIALGAGSITVVHQIRAKSRFKRPQDQGVIVRLLEDIPKFGRKDAIFRVERGRMRNEWYPKNKAEYMTTARFLELGISRADVGERDSSFIPAAQMPESPAEPEVPPAPTSAPEFTLKVATEMCRLLETLPETIAFARKPVPQSISPLVANASEQPSRPIFGSVTTLDVANEIKKLLSSELDSSPISFGPQNIRFVDLKVGSDRIKALGRWAVDIAIEGPAGSDSKTVQRTVEVLPME